MKTTNSFKLGDIVSPKEGINRSNNVDIGTATKFEVISTPSGNYFSVKVLEGFIIYNDKKYSIDFTWNLFQESFELYVEGDKDYDLW